jgi:hypothetical protein
MAAPQNGDCRVRLSITQLPNYQITQLTSACTPHQQHLDCFNVELFGGN